MSMTTQRLTNRWLALSRAASCSPMTAQNGSDHWWHKWVECSRYRESRCNPSPCHLPNGQDMTYQLINHSCVRICWKYMKIKKSSMKTSSLLDQQGSRRIVPGIQVHLEPSIQASTRKPGKVHGGRAQDADCPSIGICEKISDSNIFGCIKCGS